MLVNARKLFATLLIVLCISSCGGSGSNSTAPGEKGDKGDKGDTGGKGDTGDSGAGISSNKKIDADIATDRCDSDDIFCSFYGGQRVTLEDGTVLVMADWYYVNSDTTINDTDVSSILMVIPQATSSAAKVLGGQVKLPLGQGGSGQTRKMLIKYTRALDSVSLFWDEDNSGTVTDGDDEFALTLSNW